MRKYSHLDKSEPVNTDLPMVGPSHDLNQFDIAEWLLDWMNENWDDMPEIGAYRVERHVPSCGHTSIIIKIIMDTEESDQVLESMEDLLYDAVNDYNEETFGTHGFIEEYYTDPRGNHLRSETLHHIYISILSKKSMKDSAAKLLETMIKTIPEDSKLRDALEQLNSNLPDDMKLDLDDAKPNESPITRFLTGGTEDE